MTTIHTTIVMRGIKNDGVDCRGKKMLKTWNEMRKIDVKPYCSKRDGILYLNWAACIALLHENGAEHVSWVSIPNGSTGNSLRRTDEIFTDKNGATNRCYETRIKVVIDDMEFEIQTPVMNGTNPVKDNSMSQQRTWNSMTRAFVKGVAMHTGLGFDLWLKEEFNQMENKVAYTKDDNADESKIKVIKQVCASHGIDADKWVKDSGKTWKTLTNAEAAWMLNYLKESYGDD